jgi:hypothetical protein
LIACIFDPMADDKLTDGLNDRPKNSSIGQTAGGLPDDSSQPVDVDDETVETTKQKLSENPRKKLWKRSNSSRTHPDWDRNKQHRKTTEASSSRTIV